MQKRSPDDAAIDAWARFVRVGQAVLAGVEAELKAKGHPPLAWYDALLELRRAGDDGVRANELERRMLLAQYNLSRLADRLEAAGLVTRSPVPGDRRGRVLAITEGGQALLAAMWPDYRAAIMRHFADRLGLDGAVTLRGLMDRLDPQRG